MSKKLPVKDVKGIVSAEEWAKETIYPVVKDVLVTLQECDESFGPDMTLFLLESLIGSVLGSVVYKTLNDDYRGLKVSEGEAATAAFAALKGAIQAGVSRGMSMAVKEWTGEHLDYWCVITAGGKSVNGKAI